MAEEAALFADEWRYRIQALESTPHGTTRHRTIQWLKATFTPDRPAFSVSRLKRAIIDYYHDLSVNHLESYLDEMAFRYHNRENAYLFRDTQLRLIKPGGMTYLSLIAS